MAKKKILDDSNSTPFPFEDFLNRSVDSNPTVSGGRIPPQAIDVEAAVLGAVLIDNDAFFKVGDLLDEECFYHPGHRLIMKSMIEMNMRNEAIDLLTLTSELKRNNLLDSVGGTVYLAELTNRVASSANIEYHSRIVLEKFIYRRVISVGAELSMKGYNAQEDAFDLLDYAEKKLFEVGNTRLKKGVESLNKIIAETMDRLMELQKVPGGITGVATGFPELDKMTSGLQPSDLIILAARPSMGKTAFALSMALNSAIKAEKAVLVFSLEMSSRSLVERMLYSQARVDAHMARTNRISASEWGKVANTAGKLSKAKIFIDDTSGISIMEMRAKARRLKEEQNIQLILVDYLQLVTGPQAGSREQEISAISRSLKGLAKDLNVPIIALSQLSRAVEARKPPRPILSDLRESGSIEQDADIVMFIYRPEYYKETETEDGSPAEGVAEIIIGKQRNGPTGTVLLQFNKNYASFENRYFDEYAKPVSSNGNEGDSHDPNENTPF